MDFPDEITIGDCYGPAMKITDYNEAQEYLAGLIRRQMRLHPGRSFNDARKVELANLGYYSGYGSQETMKRVQALFGAVHPVFGEVR